MEKKITDEMGQHETNLTIRNWIPAHEAKLESAIQDVKLEVELREALEKSRNKQSHS